MSTKATHSLGNPARLVIAALASAMLLAGCNSSTAQQVDEQVAIAKQAAERAVEAQKAAERAVKLARAQSGPATFGEDQIFEEIDDSSSEDMYDSSYDNSSDSSDGTIGDDGSSAGIVPR